MRSLFLFTRSLCPPPVAKRVHSMREVGAACAVPPNTTGTFAGSREPHCTGIPNHVPSKTAHGRNNMLTSARMLSF